MWSPVEIRFSRVCLPWSPFPSLLLLPPSSSFPSSPSSFPSPSSPSSFPSPLPPPPPPSSLLYLQGIQNRLGHRQGIDHLLIKPVQRISMYKLLLRDLHTTAKKMGVVTPAVEKAVQITQEVPKRANDAMTLSMIYGYEGNMHNHGQIILMVGVVCCHGDIMCYHCLPFPLIPTTSLLPLLSPPPPSSTLLSSSSSG